MEDKKELGSVRYDARDGQQVTLSFEIIKKYLVQGKSELVTVPEMIFFMGVCKSRGLNPFIKDCYLIKYDLSPAAIITSIDYFRKRAKAQKDCTGWDCGCIVERNKEIVYTNGLVLESDKLLGGWCEGEPEGWKKPKRIEVNLPGYVKKRKDGSVTKFWSKENQPSQISKVAESQGLRAMWPDEFQMLYTPEEMGQPDTFKTSENIIQKQTADLTKDIKNGGKPPEGATVYQAEDITEPTPEPEQEEKDSMPDLFKWIKGARPGTSDKNKAIFVKTVKDNPEEIQGWPKEQQDYLQAKWEAKVPGEPYPFLEKVEIEVGFEHDFPQEEPQEPSGEQNSGSGGTKVDNSDSVERMGFYEKARQAKEIFAENGKIRLYMGVLSDFDCETMNDIPVNKQDEFIKALHRAIDQMNE